ncbi:hypothetical protein L9F63_016662, partial [Diploptera punctata]
LHNVRPSDETDREDGVPSFALMLPCLSIAVVMRLVVPRRFARNLLQDHHSNSGRESLPRRSKSQVKRMTFPNKFVLMYEAAVAQEVLGETRKTLRESEKYFNSYSFFLYLCKMSVLDNLFAFFYLHLRLFAC